MNHTDTPLPPDTASPGEVWVYTDVNPPVYLITSPAGSLILHHSVGGWGFHLDPYVLPILVQQYSVDHAGRLVPGPVSRRPATPAERPAVEEALQDAWRRFERNNQNTRLRLFNALESVKSVKSEHEADAPVVVDGPGRPAA